MKYHIGRGSSAQAEACVNEATKLFSNPKLVLYYSPADQFGEYTRLLHEKYPNSICMGATTIVSIGKDGASKTGLMAVGIEEGITCSAGVLEDADTYPVKYVGRVVDCVKQLGSKSNSICLEFTTALKCAEESVLSTLNSVLLDYNIPVFGGSAGDDTSGVATYVALNGRVYENSSTFCLIHNESGPIHIFRENIYKPVTGHILTATKVDYVTRTVKEYDHQPATTVFAKELGVPESEISKYFDTNPMGRIIGEEMYITANCAKTQDHGMTYHARVYNNSRLVVLGPDNYREVIKQTREKIKQEIPHPSFAIMCHCLARTLLFDGDNYLQTYAKEMGEVLGDYIGFSGYGEQLGRQQFNQTMSVIVFE